jgi:hypothetical protein
VEPDDRDLRANPEQPPEIRAMPGTISRRVESTEHASSEEVDEEMMKASMMMIMKMKMKMRKSLVEQYVVGFVRHMF